MTIHATKTAQLIRTLTVAPIMALALLTLVFAQQPGALGGWPGYLCSLLFLTVLPLAAYPLQPFIPGYRDQGRRGQRNLAIVMSVVGYLGGIGYALLAKASAVVWMIFGTYFISGLGILLFNKVIRLGASGHACGVAGPVALAYLLLGRSGAVLWLGALLLALVYWASLVMQRHTLKQLLCGTGIPLVSLGLTQLLANNFY